MPTALDRFKTAIRRNRAPGAPYHLIVGLGNPGRRYARNRHNIGFRCVDELARVFEIDLRRNRMKTLLGEGCIGRHQVVLLKPLTFMNQSGRPVGQVARRYKVPPEQMLVIHDDLDLPLGRIRLRPGGSSGGHRGIKSIIAALGTQGFARLRIGIGRPSSGDPVDYVLSNFSSDQDTVIAAVAERVVDVVSCYLREGLETAMNVHNSEGAYLSARDDTASMLRGRRSDS